jgi:hypothetical protein
MMDAIKVVGSWRGAKAGGGLKNYWHLNARGRVLEKE